MMWFIRQLNSIRFKKRICLSGIVLTTILILLAHCAPSRWASRIDWPGYSLDTVPGQKDYPEAGAVILLDEADLEVGGSSEITFSRLERHVIVKILNERGFANANVLVPYGRETRITGIQGRTIRPNGDIALLEKDQIFDTNLYPDYVFYSDIRAKRFTMPAIEPGCIVEYRWNKTVGNFTFWTQWQFQHDDPVLVSRYNIRCPKHWDISWKAYGVAVEPKIDQISRGMQANHTWEVRNLPPILPEAGMPNASEQAAHLMFSPIGVSRWEDIGKWFLELAEDRIRPNDEIRKIVREITEETSSRKEKLERIYDFVREKIRYVAIEIGIGGYQPHAAEDILKNRYGDCKDMVALIVAMANAAGIDVYPVLISTWQNGKVDTTLVSQAYFNHAIAHTILPDSTELWMDATHKSTGFGDLPWYDQNRLAFVIQSKEKSRFQRTPASEAIDNLMHRKWKLALDSTGCIAGSVKLTYTGTPASEERLNIRFMHPKEFESNFGRELLSRYPGFECRHVRFDGLDDLGKSLNIHGEFTSSKRINRNDSCFVFQPGALSHFEWYEMFGESKRRYDIELRFPMHVVDEIELSYPVHWRCDVPFKEKTIEKEYGSIDYSIVCPEPGRIFYRRDFQSNAVCIPKETYADFKRFINLIGEYDKRVISFGFHADSNNRFDAVYDTDTVNRQDPLMEIKW